MQPTQEWQQSFVVAVGIEELSHDPPHFRTTDHNDDVRVLVIRAAARPTTSTRKREPSGRTDWTVYRSHGS